MKHTHVKSPTKSEYHVNAFGVLVDEQGNRKPLKPGISSGLRETVSIILISMFLTGMAMGFIYWLA